MKINERNISYLIFLYFFKRICYNISSPKGMINMNIKEIVTLLPDRLMCIKEVSTNTIIYPEDDAQLAYLGNLKRISNDEFYDIDSKRYFQKKVNYTQEGLEICHFIDITKYKKEILKLETDPVLNIPIKRKLNEDLIEYLRICRYLPMAFSLVMLDVDHFKKINDTYGHMEGDRVLKDIANFLRNNTRHNTNPNAKRRPEDGIYRFGGEEIILLLKNISPENTERRLNEIREKQANRTYEFQKNDTELCHENITFSAGVVTVPKKIVLPNSDEEAKLFIERKIKEADEQLYYAKETGRNKVKMLYN